MSRVALFAAVVLPWVAMIGFGFKGCAEFGRSMQYAAKKDAGETWHRMHITGATEGTLIMIKDGEAVAANGKITQSRDWVPPATLAWGAVTVFALMLVSTEYLRLRHAARSAGVIG